MAGREPDRSGKERVPLLVPLGALALIVAIVVLSLLRSGDGSGTITRDSGGTPVSPGLPKPTATATVAEEDLRKPDEEPLSEATTPALEFLRGYLAFSYGQGRLSAIRYASPELIRALKADRPRVPPSMRKLEPHVTSLQTTEQAPGAVIATSTVSDGGGGQYPLVFHLERRDGKWLVTSLADD